MLQKSGGYTPDMESMTPEVMEMAIRHKMNAEDCLNTTFSAWEPIGFTSQVVGGFNYWIKVHVGDNSYVHMKIFESLPGNGSQTFFREIETGKSKQCSLVP